MKLTIFLLLAASPKWLALDRSERDDISDAALNAVFCDETITFRFYDAEAFNAHVSDIMVITAETATAYYFAIERLRDTALVANSYWQIVDIIPAYEDGYRAFSNAQ